MPLPRGVFIAKNKSGKEYYRVSVTYKGKHISLGSFDNSEDASNAYAIGRKLLWGEDLPGGQTSRFDALPGGQTPRPNYEIDDYEQYGGPLSFDKWVSLINLAKSGIYCRTPILLEHKYFKYYVSRNTVLTFDVDDLFYYMNHKIMQRGGRYFVADYGMQVGILSRYGIKSFAVVGRDYIFKNGDKNDLRYSNIEIINQYFGVFRSGSEGRYTYTAKVHLNGDNIIGHYANEEEAAVAYNKATDILEEHGYERPFYKNYIEKMTSTEYKALYDSIKINNRIYNL